MKKKLLILLVFVANNLFAQNLTSNNLIVVRIGDGSSALGTTSAAAFFDEYKTDGTLVQSVPLPTSVQGVNKRLTLSGDKTDEGYISLSPDADKIALFGYDCDLGATAPSTTTSASVNRVIGVLTADKSVNTTKYLNSMFSTVVARSATVSGDNLWVTGGNTGIVHTTYNSTGAITANTILATTGRVLSIYDGQLYISSLGSGVRMGKVGTGLPVTTGQTITSLPGYPTGASDAPFQYVFSDQNVSIPGVDVLYVADALRGLLKYSFDGTDWVYNGVITGGSYMGLAARKVGSSMQLYGTRRIGSSASTYQFQLFTITDDGGHNASFSNTVVTTLATAGTNTVFRGITFTPGTNTLGIAEVKQNIKQTDLQVYASAGVLRAGIYSSLLGPGKLVIYNLSGNRLYEKSLDLVTGFQEHIIGTGLNYPSGVYIAVFTNSKQTVSQKFIL